MRKFVKKPRSKKNNRRHYGQGAESLQLLTSKVASLPEKFGTKNESRNRKKLLQKSRKNNHKRRRTKKMKGGVLSNTLKKNNFL
jgi:hypothetical protein